VPGPAARGRDAEHPSGPIPRPDFGLAAAPPPAAAKPPARVPVIDDRTGVALPAPPATPLPLEAEAMRAASAAAAPGREGMATGPVPPAPAPAPARQQSRQRSRQRRTGGRRKDTERLFTDLASLAGIPTTSYAVGDEVDGAMCMLETAQGFEVFLAAAGDRHELQIFATEEAACFYLFGVLVAEEVRTGALARVVGARQGWHSQTA
jgi:hypothetical protein